MRDDEDAAAPRSAIPDGEKVRHRRELIQRLAAAGLAPVVIAIISGKPRPARARP